MTQPTYYDQPQNPANIDKDTLAPIVQKIINDENANIIEWRATHCMASVAALVAIR